jgi:hypothetical protein
MSVNLAADQLCQVEGEMKIIQFPIRAVEEPFACPHWCVVMVGLPQAEPDGFMASPADLQDCTDLELIPYIAHVDSCDDCNEV